MTTPRRILFATQNTGKQRELQAILAELGVELVLPSDVGLKDLDIDETGTTFEQNAILKATGFAAASNLPTIADDSGLEVMALGGEPGVYSKRFGKDDPERMSKLLDLLKDKDDRSAQFRSVLCYFDPQQGEAHCEAGIVKGDISLAMRGDKGFGYDPVFIPEGYQRTFAELGDEIKNQISHRARAAQALKEWFKTTTFFS